jgi:hypothetical protein
LEEAWSLWLQPVIKRMDKVRGFFKILVFVKIRGAIEVTLVVGL